MAVKKVVALEDAEETKITPIKSVKKKKVNADEMLEPVVPAEDADAVETKPKAKPKTKAKPKKKKATAIKIDEQEFVDELTPDEQADINWSKVKALAKRKGLIEGRVTGIRPLSDSGNVDPRSNDWAIMSQIYGYPVLIPKSHFFELETSFFDDYKDLSKAEQNERQYIEAGYMLGARIVMKVVGAKRSKRKDGQDYNYYVGASRTEAMQELRDAYFGEDSTVKVGDEVKARVLKVMERHVKVEVYGVESFIDSYNLSNKFIPDCREFTKTGDVLDGVIRKLSKTDNGKIKMTVSCSLLKREHAKQYINAIAVGGMYLGTVFSYNKDKHLYNVVLENGVQATVHEDRVVGRRVMVGDKVAVRVFKKMEDAGFVLGSILRLGHTR